MFRVRSGQVLSFGVWDFGVYGLKVWDLESYFMVWGWGLTLNY